MLFYFSVGGNRRKPKGIVDVEIPLLGKLDNVVMDTLTTLFSLYFIFEHNLLFRRKRRPARRSHRQMSPLLLLPVSHRVSKSLQYHT